MPTERGVSSVPLFIDFAYPALELLSDQTIFTAIYGHWKSNEQSYISGLHFTVDEVDYYAN